MCCRGVTFFNDYHLKNRLTDRQKPITKEHQMNIIDVTNLSDPERETLGFERVEINVTQDEFDRIVDEFLEIELLLPDHLRYSKEQVIEIIKARLINAD
jgi:hypothetical protein